MLHDNANSSRHHHHQHQQEQPEEAWACDDDDDDDIIVSADADAIHSGFLDDGIKSLKYDWSYFKYLFLAGKKA
jgi:hypothetical protein